MVSLILSTIEPSQDLVKPFFFVPVNHRMLFLVRGRCPTYLAPLLVFKRLNIEIK